MRNGIRFLLGGEVHRVTGFDPSLTILCYLRESLGRCGSKEGCAEGDCGACTVVIGSLAGARVAYRAVNACIALLGSLDGKQLITVEDLADAHGKLHAVQRFMVENHGSQCGFCTPGIVMSLFALHHASGHTGPNEINDALVGNLCRCTGYGPILESGRQAAEAEPTDHFSTASTHTVALLKSIAVNEPVAVNHQGSLYLAPCTVSQLLVALEEHPEAVMVAGCTDVGLWITKQHRQLNTLISLVNIQSLQGIEQYADGVHIGAMVTYSDALEVIARHYPDFAEMLRLLGGLQVRNAGTLGGNIVNGSPIGDSPPALMALGARIRLHGATGVREIALEDFFLDYGKQDLRRGEFLEEIILPLPQPGWCLRCYKVSKRREQDISALSAAIHVKLQDQGAGPQVADIRIAYGGMAAVPKRARALEQRLRGERWDTAVVSHALDALDQDFSPITDLRATAAYRREVARNLVLRCVLETGPEAPPTRLHPVAEMNHV